MSNPFVAAFWLLSQRDKDCIGWPLWAKSRHLQLKLNGYV
jgi:hypothetical protein